MDEDNEDDRITDEQIKQLRRIEDIRKSKGLSGYKDAFEYLLSGFMKQENLTQEDLVEAKPPDPDVVGEMTVGDRTYEILSIFHEDEDRLDGFTIERRVQEMKANVGKEEGCYIIEHKYDIPRNIMSRFKYIFFIDWREREYPGSIAYLKEEPYSGVRAQEFGDFTSTFWLGGCVLRRKA